MPDDSHLPELTRSLRGLGSHRGADAALEQAVFGPLLDARRAAERASSSEEAMRAFDADALAERIGRALNDIARARAMGRPDRERALDAELEELAAPLTRALHQLSLVDRADPESWTGATRRVFGAADSVVAAIGRALGATAR